MGGVASCAKPRYVQAVQPSAPWTELSTAHFAVATDLPEREAAHVARELEEYLSALIQTIMPASAPPSGRILVVAFATGTEIDWYFRSVYKGVYVHRLLDGPAIVTGGQAGAFYDGIARHELAHYVTDLAYHRPLPLWFAEGTASFLETVAFEDDRKALLLGRSSWSRVSALEKQGLMPLCEVLSSKPDSRDEAEVDRFYASSWLLVHDLVSHHGDAFQAYQKLLAAGVPGDEAWTRAIPPDVRGNLDAELGAYLAGRRYQVSWRRPCAAPAVSIAARPLDRAEVLATRALVHVAAGLATGSPPPTWRSSASNLVDEALKADPANARALRIRGLLAESAGRGGL